MRQIPSFFVLMLALFAVNAPDALALSNEEIRDRLKAEVEPGIDNLMPTVQGHFIRDSYCLPPDTPNKVPDLRRLREFQAEHDRLKALYVSYRRQTRGINDPWNRQYRSAIGAIGGKLGRLQAAITAKQNQLDSVRDRDCSPPPPPPEEPEDDGKITTGGGGITGGGGGEELKEPEDKPEETAPPPKPKPVTTPAKPKCPQCNPIRRNIADTQSDISHAEANKRSKERKRTAKQNELNKVEAKVTRLERLLSGQEGVGAESTDTTTGITTSSYDNGKGQVEIKRFDKNGNQIGQTEYRDRPSTKKNRQKLEKARKQQKALKKELKAIDDEISAAQKAIDKLKKKLASLRQQLADCLRRCKTVVVPPKKTDVRVGDDFEIELEDARSTDGTNAFDPQQVEQLDLHDPIDRVGEVVVPPQPPAHTTGGTPQLPPQPEPEIEIETVVPQPPVQQPPAEDTPPPPPPQPPLQATASGSVNFTHVVRESPCPQAAGSINVSTNTGNDFEIVSATAMGSIAPKLNVQIQGKKVVVQFNCSSADNGTFTGSIAITVRDKKTGKTASPPPVAAKGTVTGP